MKVTVIADEDLAWYLMDKITTKPDYGYDTMTIPVFLKRTLDNRKVIEAERDRINRRNMPSRKR